MLMECLAVGRAISLPALSTGAGKLAVPRHPGAYARIRRQFKLPIGRLEGIEEPLARMAGVTYLMEAARVMTCAAMDRGKKPSVMSAIVKYQLTKRMRRVVNDGMDVQGGGGISLGPRNMLGRVYQSIPIGITVEGANILTRTMIIFGQGAYAPIPDQQEIRAVADPDPQQGLMLFDRALFSHIGFIISNIARTLFLGMTGGRLVNAPGGRARRYFQKTTRMCAAFALIADASLMLLGGNLKRRRSSPADWRTFSVISTCSRRYSNCMRTGAGHRMSGRWSNGRAKRALSPSRRVLPAFCATFRIARRPGFSR